MSNALECAAGAFAFPDYDFPGIDTTSLTANGRLCLTFLSVPGKTYSVRGLADFASPE